MHGKKVAVLGCGSWGTALANHLARNGSTVILWGNEPEILNEISQKKTNSKYFPGASLAPTLLAEGDLLKATTGCDFIVVAVPSFAVAEVTRALKKAGLDKAIFVNAAKGLEGSTSRFLGSVIGDELGSMDRVAVLSGPSFALEVLNGLPTAVTVAAQEESIRAAVADLFHSDSFRVYTSSDIIGAEVGGAVKNVIALAVGMVDGLQMGANARAAVITRGLAEITRLALALGGDARTIMGLSGLGDLLLTATGDLSRNRRVGLALGEGRDLKEILVTIGQVAEGVEAAPKVLQLAKARGIEMPIVEEVVAVLNEKYSVRDAGRRLLSREKTSETF